MTYQEHMKKHQKINKLYNLIRKSKKEGNELRYIQLEAKKESILQLLREDTKRNKRISHYDTGAIEKHIDGKKVAA